jgi:hypothetical protein
MNTEYDLYLIVATFRHGARDYWTGSKFSADAKKAKYYKSHSAAIKARNRAQSLVFGIGGVVTIEK